VNLGWKLRWDDLEWTAADLTVAECASLELLLGGGWGAIDPTASPVHLMNHIAVHVGEATGLDYEMVVAKLRLEPLPRLLAAMVT
jgi:hypothetical protein